MDKSITLSHPVYEEEVNRMSSQEPHNFRAKAPDDVEVIKLAYAVFRAYKGVLVEHKFTFEEYGRIRQLLQNRTDLFAFRIAQAELEILHDVLYTKAQMFHEKFGNTVRFVYWALLAAALASFSLLVRNNNKQFDPFDVGLTYSLLIGGMCLDAIAFVVLLYSSTFTIATMSRATSRPITWLVKILKSLNWPRARALWCWKPSLQQLNLISYGLNQPPKVWQRIIDSLHVTNYLDEMKYVENKRLSPILEAEILRQVEMSLHRHDWDCYSYASTFAKCTSKFHVSKELDKGEFLIVWHIVTEIFFNIVDGPEANNIGYDSRELNKFRQCSKSLSDYMFYILIFRPFFMPVPNKKKIEDTNYQIKKLLHGKKNLGQREACQEIMTKAAEDPILHKSFLYEAFKVVKCLRNVSPWRQDQVKCWKTIHKTWIAILFDAVKCSAPRAHAQYIVRGGEILSLIWLLGANCGSMAQFAFFEDSDEENQTS